MSSTSNPPAPLSSDLQEILDNYYAPIKLPEDNRQGLVTALESYIQSRERAARIDELKRLPFKQNGMVYTFQIAVLDEYKADRIAELSNNEGAPPKQERK